jgi:hypothetical protein
MQLDENLGASYNILGFKWFIIYFLNGKRLWTRRMSQWTEIPVCPPWMSSRGRAVHSPELAAQAVGGMVSNRENA